MVFLHQYFHVGIDLLINQEDFIRMKEKDLLSAVKVPNPFGLALKSPNRGPVGTGDGDKIETGDGLNTARTGELLGPSLSDHDGAR
jgi:hypothetical protein